MNDLKTTEEIHDILRNWILDGKLLPGEKLNQIKISEELNVSRTPVVKALHKLATEGMVDSFPQRGFFIHHLSLKELYDLFILRESLEKIVIQDIIDNLSEKDLARMEGVFKQFINSKGIDIKTYRTKDRQFHNLLFELCSNKFAKRINESFQILNRTFLSGLVRPPEDTLGEHLRIIAALKKKDKQEAILSIGDHDSTTLKRISQIMKGMQEFGIDPARTNIGDVSFDKK